jgi:hypothetical protein
MQMTCHLQANISPTTIVAKKSGNAFFFKNLISKSFQPKNTFLTFLEHLQINSSIHNT